ncbi:MAG: DUF2971 domain-containing protein [Eubacteriales bacterium]|nr:DUF2971 domain-containing protein [Eubacteriales bacterium]
MKQNAASRNLQRTVFIACFSERPDSLLMWGHYANNHRGICVGYDLKKLIENYDCLPVIYEEELPQNINNAHILKDTLTKYRDWEYEKEWRIIKTDENIRGDRGKIIDFVKPKKIILGCKNNDFLWDTHKENNVSCDEELLSEIDANKLIVYAKEKLKTECYQYQMCVDRFGSKKIIRI